MFLSDELISIGEEANKKNNLSQATQAKLMHNVLIREQSNSTDSKKLINTADFAVKELNKKGFNYYSLGLFYKTN